VDLITKIVEKWGWKCVGYHGGKAQDQREAAIDGFKHKKYDILVATDLAGRGLDVEGVKMVINFDTPKKISDFIHRTGRTGRAGKKGLAISFLTNHDEEIYYDLKEFLIKNNQEVPSELANHPATKIKPGSIPENVPRRKQVLYA
jgi:ATP-dependent RNA helicase DDX23/PRP28